MCCITGPLRRKSAKMLKYVASPCLPGITNGGHGSTGAFCARSLDVSGGIHLKEYLASTEDVLKEQSTNAETGLTSAEAQKREAKLFEELESDD